MPDDERKYDQLNIGNIGKRNAKTILDMLPVIRHYRQYFPPMFASHRSEDTF